MAAKCLTFFSLSFQQLISYEASFKSTVLIKKEARKTLLDIHNSIKLMRFK